MLCQRQISVIAMNIPSKPDDEILILQIVKLEDSEKSVEQN